MHFYWIYLGVFCYLNLCKYAQHVDSDIAAELCWPGRSGWRRILHPTTGSPARRRIIGMPTVVVSVFTVSPAACRRRRDYLCSIGCDFAGDSLFFPRKFIFEQDGFHHSVTGIVCAANQRVSPMRGRWFLCSAAFIPICRVLCVFMAFFCFSISCLPRN